MNNDRANPRITPGLWARLKLLLEAVGDSYEEQLERRVSRLEREVERLVAGKAHAGSK